MKKSKKQINILQRLLKLFFIMVLPIMIIGIFIQFQANQSIKNNILSSISSRLENTISQINQKFVDSNHLASYILSDSKAQRIANSKDPMSAYSRTVNVNYVRNLLYNIKLSNAYINNIRLSLPEMGIYYNTEYAYNYESYNYLGSQGELTDLMYEELLSMMNSSSQVHIRNNQMIFLQFSPLHDPRIFIETVYVIPELKNMFFDTLLYQNSYYYFSMRSYDYEVTNYTGKDQLPEFDTNQPYTKVNIQGEQYYAFRSEIPEADGYYIQFIPSDELFINMELSIKYSIIFTFTVLVCCLLFIMGAFRIIHSPVKKLSNGLKQIENNNFSVRLDASETSDFQYLYDCFNHMSEQLYHLIQQELQHEILLNKAQLKQLQAQVNPHFLYNSFFMLNQMIAREMYDEARVLSKDLGSYFKYVTRNYTDEVSLSDEYEHTRLYANIQAKRFVGRIEIHMEELPADYCSLPTPKLILQPILENSFKYGVEDKIRDGLIQITFQTEDRLIRIMVDDNGEILTDEVLCTLQENLQQASLDTLRVETTGLINICKRLQLYYGRKDVMSASRSPLGGLQICITLYRKERSNASTSNC